MSIASEIMRLQSAKATLKTKLNARNDPQHQITTETLEDYGAFVDSISGGGVDVNIFVQTTQPSTYDGVWIKSDSFTYSNVYETYYTTDTLASSINFYKVSLFNTYKTKLFNYGENLQYNFTNIILTDDNNEELENIKVYYGDGTEWKPLRYTELEYIESTGTQYINTNADVANATSLEINFDFIPTSTTNNYNEYLTVKDVIELFINNQGKMSFKYNGKRADNFQTLSVGTRYKYKIVLANGTITIYNNNAQLATINNVTSPTSASSLTFLRFAVSSEVYYARAKVYAFSIKINDVLTRDFIPVKNLNGVPCLYDKVSKSYFNNAGTGTFVAGSEIEN